MIQQTIEIELSIMSGVHMSFLPTHPTYPTLSIPSTTPLCRRHSLSVLFSPAKGSGRPISEVAPLLCTTHGSKRVDPRKKRIERG
jgi:hypothetical protein